MKTTKKVLFFAKIRRDTVKVMFTMDSGQKEKIEHLPESDTLWARNSIEMC